ncbi:hypothetical protein [Pseudofrankia asymbiotica]|uniref:Helix-turn-helix domain-containing protein n=1 Tax=Pseudofrankia asymbiotica TaxID=1834516 RepID=A0A1V2I052_9ACTN|nr:hypothetical protein [Pseudofrankia asymbiotica]ONH22559.1 hypothetical protein BL253_35325 [Pseudofrankia asymbiotica]
MRTPLTLAEVRELPAAVDLVTAARAFNLGRTLAYTLARQNRFPVPVHRHGRAYRVHTTDILNALTDPEPRPTPEPAEQ